MISLKEKTISGIIWSFVDNSFTQIITFVVGIILARFLSPEEFGLIGMVSIFLAVSQSFVDSGFSQALLRKKNCSDKDYSTVFFFNLGIAVIFYLILFFSSGLIADFFKQEKLIELTKVVSLSIVLEAFGLVQQTQMTKKIQIKIQTKISVIANVTSGIVAVSMAYSGFGVWSLVFRNLSNIIIRNLFLWYFNKWRPRIVFSIQSFNEMFTFGSKLLLSGLLNKIFENLYYFIIGKYFSAQQLGFYTRAETFTRLPSSNINSVVQRISFPILSEIQYDNIALKKTLKKLIKTTMFITMFLMFLMAASAEALVITLIGEKWRQSIKYLQLLSFSYFLFPLHSLNLNMINVKGRSDLFLLLEIIKKIFVIPVIFIGIFYGIESLLFGTILYSILAYFLNSYFNRKIINYTWYEQIMDLIPTFLLTSIIGTLVYIIGQFLEYDYIILLFIQFITGSILVIVVSEFIKLEPYLDIKRILLDKFKKIK